MSEIKDIFYNLFWQNKACQNLFLLSKEELLDTKSIPIIDIDSRSISFPRIIISNVDKEADSREIIKYRTEGGLIKSEASVNSKIEKYQPLFTSFIENKFEKPLEKITKELYDDPSIIAGVIMNIVVNSPDKKEEIIIKELQRYGFIGKHINSLTEAKEFFKKEIFTKNIKDILSEENIWNFFELLKSLKDIYINESYKSLYESNQVLVNSLFDFDDFINRLKLFNHLYEAEIISASHEDAYVECTNCPPGAYRGTLQLKINPLKLKDFKCPICGNSLNYYVPYELHPEIYGIIKSKDGLLLDALRNLLTSHQIHYEVNQTFLNDIELDCLFYKEKESIYVVECKMYKINTLPQRLKSKMKEHYAKLLADVKRLEEEIFKNKEIVPILLVNITQEDIIFEVKEELEHINNNKPTIHILNINEIEDLIVNIPL
jgi:hypothetical protein